MTEFDGPAFNQKKEPQSLKNRRFNQLSQRESTKTHFEPAMKERRRKFPTDSEHSVTPTSSEQALFPDRLTKKKSNQRMVPSPNKLRQQEQILEGQARANHSRTQQQAPQSTRSTLEEANRATPQADYDIPFLKRQDKQVKKLNQASLENAMNERQTQPMSQPVQPNRPVRTLAETYPRTTKTQQEYKQDTIETSVKTTETLHTQQEVAASKSIFQPTELPKPYKGNERRKEDVEEIRDLAKRLVKTRETFLLFEN